MLMFLRCGAVPVITAGLLAAPLAAPALAALQIESRGGEVLISPFNIGYSQAFGVGTVGGFGPGDLVGTDAGLTSADDLMLGGDLFYGPDNFDRVNAGAYAALQDVTLSANTLGARLEQSSFVTGTASPSVDVSNTFEAFFTVTQDVTAGFSVQWAGDLQVGARERVSLGINKVDASGDSQGSVFGLYSEVLNQNGSGGDGNNFTVGVSLVAGQRYHVFARGDANSVGSKASLMDFALVVPEPASAGLLAAGLLPLMARRRRADRG